MHHAALTSTLLRQNFAFTLLSVQYLMFCVINTKRIIPTDAPRTRCSFNNKAIFPIQEHCLFGCSLKFINFHFNALINFSSPITMSPKCPYTSNFAHFVFFFFYKNIIQKQHLPLSVVYPTKCVYLLVKLCKKL